MINLIPPEGHQVMKQEHLSRIGGTLCFLFGGVFLLLTVALIPTYALIGAQIHTLDLEMEQQSDKVELAKKLDEDLDFSKIILEQLKNASATISKSSAIEDIQDIASADISFKAFSVAEPDKKGVVKIQAQGIAPTREALVQLKSAIEASHVFEKAEIPISDLARDVDLPFVITITLSPQT